MRNVSSLQKVLDRVYNIHILQVKSKVDPPVGFAGSCKRSLRD
jgi:hypothetical protein